jgi:hypothetical protein
MGLRLLTVFFDRSEALVARSALDAAGIFTALHNLDILVTAPYYTLGLGGYRLLVCEDDIEAASSIVAEALGNPALAHERLKVDGDGLDYVLSFVVGLVAGGAPAAVRRRRWVADVAAGT